MNVVSDEARLRPLGVAPSRLVVLSSLIVVGLVGVLGLVQHLRARAGVVRNASCVWHGRNLVMSASVVNTTSSQKTFVLTPGFALNGRTVQVPGDWAVHVDPRGATTWRWVDGHEVDRAGARVTACTPSVTLPSSDD
jgi:hypothetical protein